jgi:hypothetical protein
MKALVSALALLVGSNVMAAAADQTLKFKLWRSTPIKRMANIILTKDFSVKEDQNGKGAGQSTYYFPDGSIVASDSFVDTETQTGGHVVGKIQIVSGTGAYQGATGGGSLTGIGATKAAQGRGALQHRIGRDDTGNLTREPSRGRLHSPPRWASQKRGARRRAPVRGPPAYCSSDKLIAFAKAGRRTRPPVGASAWRPI